jgi:antitoxin FitA
MQQQPVHCTTNCPLSASISIVMILFQGEAMHAALTIHDLDAAVTQKLQLRALRNGRTVEAEVREIVTVAVGGKLPSEVSLPANDASHTEAGAIANEGKFDHVIGMWKGRMSTDDVMHLTRGE